VDRAAAIPSPSAVRRLTRGYRRRHVPRRFAEFASDVYVMLLALAMIVAAVVDSVRRLPVEPDAVRTPSAGAALAATVVLLFAGAGLLALGAVGPLSAGAAPQTWQLSAPVDRAGWLLPGLGWLLTGAAAVGATTGAVASLAVHGGLIGLAWSAGAGAVVAATVAATAVVAQARPGRGAVLAGRALLAAGLPTALLALAADRHGLATRPALAAAPARALSVAAAAVGTAGLVAATVGAVRALPRLDRAALGAGVVLAGSAAVAVVGMDPSLLFTVVQVQRLRRIGRVSPRPLRARGRIAVLLRAETRRLRRHPAALLEWAALAIAPYLAAVVLAPPLVTAARVAAGYVAVNALAGGLRTVCRSSALRRALGGTDASLRGTHLVLPAVAALAWVGLTAGAGRHLSPATTGVLVLGLTASVYRTANRQPLLHDAAWISTPAGLIPVGMILQVLRGPDLAVILAVVLAHGL
jgi:hypothetical protein